MAKRKKSANKSQQQASNSSKRPRHDDDNELGKFESSRGYIDPSTGQRGAFPGLENYDDDFFGPPMDGIDYLRMVRYVASPPPSVPPSKLTNPPGPKPKASQTSSSPPKPAQKPDHRELALRRHHRLESAPSRRRQMTSFWTTTTLLHRSPRWSS